MTNVLPSTNRIYTLTILLIISNDITKNLIHSIILIDKSLTLLQEIFLRDPSWSTCTFQYESTKKDQNINN